METTFHSQALPTLPPPHFPEDLITVIHSLAHQGTKEALDELHSIIDQENDPQFKEYAQCALDECSYFYYSPQNEKEEKEFDLVKLIHKSESELFEQEMKKDGLIFRKNQEKLFIKIAENFVKKIKAKKKKEKFELQILPKIDFVETLDHEYCETEKKTLFLKEWIKEAKKSLTIEKYKTIPSELLFHFHDDFEYWEEG